MKYARNKIETFASVAEYTSRQPLSFDEKAALEKLVFLKRRKFGKLSLPEFNPKREVGKTMVSEAVVCQYGGEKLATPKIELPAKFRNRERLTPYSDGLVGRLIPARYSLR